MAKQREIVIPASKSGGNVFADMGVPAPDEELTRAQLASHIRQVIPAFDPGRSGGAHGHRSAESIGASERAARELSSERLRRLLTALGQNVDIAVRATPGDRLHGRIRVLGEAQA